MRRLIRTEPVRLYSIAVAIAAVVAHYAPEVPTALYLGVVAAVLGLGETVRSSVTPNQRVIVHADEVPDGGDVVVYSREAVEG
jgi:hypothetical protein